MRLQSLRYNFQVPSGLEIIIRPSIFLSSFPVALYRETLSWNALLRRLNQESSMKSSGGQTGIYYTVGPQLKVSRTAELGGSRMNVVPIHHGSLTADLTGA